LLAFTVEMKAMNPSVFDKKCFSCSSGDIYVDFRAGDVTCLECGVIQSDRLIDQGNEQRFYEDDEGKKLSRTSGFGDSLGMYNTMFVRGSERDRTILERAQRTAINRKENAILGHLPMVNEMCTQLNLSSSIKVC
jgi:transcription initiation factor TFIIIB Brf1 subunit/transcription initiation factor TFIIB